MSSKNVKKFLPFSLPTKGSNPIKRKNHQRREAGILAPVFTDFILYCLN